MAGRSILGPGAILALTILARDGHTKAAKGYWCFTLTMGGSESSACTRSEDKCRSSAEAARSLGAGSCSFQETAWSTVVKEAGKKEEHSFASKAHCEDYHGLMGGTACKEVK